MRSHSAGAAACAWTQRRRITRRSRARRQRDSIPTPGSDGNQTTEPLLAADGFHQLAGSPTIDAGQTNSVSVGSEDIDGGPRVTGTAPDIGADEEAPLPVPPPPGECRGKAATVAVVAGVAQGTPQADVIVATAARNVIRGGGGNDTICALGGNDVIWSGAGADFVSGGSGADRVLGEDGNDLLFGGAGADRLSGGRGLDRLLGGSGADRLSGNRGPDRLFGNSGPDFLRGGPGRDILVGGAGRDRQVQ